MNIPKDVGTLIIRVLKESNEPIEADFVAYKIGSTMTQVMEEGNKLQELGLIEIEGSKIRLSRDKNIKFNSWDKLKK